MCIHIHTYEASHLSSIYPFHCWHHRGLSWEQKWSGVGIWWERQSSAWEPEKLSSWGISILRCLIHLISTLFNIKLILTHVINIFSLRLHRTRWSQMSQICKTWEKKKSLRLCFSVKGLNQLLVIPSLPCSLCYPISISKFWMEIFGILVLQVHMYEQKRKRN